MHIYNDYNNCRIYGELVNKVRRLHIKNVKMLIPLQLLTFDFGVGILCADPLWLVLFYRFFYCISHFYFLGDQLDNKIIVNGSRTYQIRVYEL